MDTNKMREQYEAWRLDQAVNGIFFGGYTEDEDDTAWLAWQASREAVVVELPDRDVEQCDYSLGFNSCLKQSRSAIEAQGLKVKP